MWVLPAKRDKLSFLLKSKLFYDEKLEYVEFQNLIDKLELMTLNLYLYTCKVTILS
jgi:hypothetical protein